MTNITFEDILDELMLEEPSPSYEALMKWSERYPQYAEALAEFFATWSLQAALAEHSKQTPIDEKRLVEKGVNYAMELLRRQGRILPVADIPSLDTFDQLVLTAVYLLHGEAYSVNITERVSEMSGTEFLLGSTFLSLDRLEKAGLISSRLADPETEPENKGRQYFTTTLAGERALARARQTSKLLADLLGDLA